MRWLVLLLLLAGCSSEKAIDGLESDIRRLSRVLNEQEQEIAQLKVALAGQARWANHYDKVIKDLQSAQKQQADVISDASVMARSAKNLAEGAHNRIRITEAVASDASKDIGDIRRAMNAAGEKSVLVESNDPSQCK